MSTASRTSCPAPRARPADHRGRLITTTRSTSSGRPASSSGYRSRLRLLSQVEQAGRWLSQSKVRNGLRDNGSKWSLSVPWLSPRYLHRWWPGAISSSSRRSGACTDRRTADRLQAARAVRTRSGAAEISAAPRPAPAAGELDGQRGARDPDHPRSDSARSDSSSMRAGTSRARTTGELVSIRLSCS
ncbi:hypothetical protein ABZ816_36160 [Actinosynnema sp. NPDC047251]|uniref:hypothetical protein n=1 Tax=Saccharothrix espanaensis TaxID=103731 RepID=UPI0002DE9F8D|nr:hypothetical protein [Saccharothrix espanaensis]